MNRADTVILCATDTETTNGAARVIPGGRVRICAGPMEGVVGTIVRKCPEGSVLVRAEHGIYIKVKRFLVQRLAVSSG